MFCQKCGTSMADGIQACPACQSPVLQPAVAGAGFANVTAQVKDAWGGAVTTLLGFAADPVGRLGQAYGGLGEAKAKRAGLTYGAVSFVCFLLGGYLLLPFRSEVFEFLGAKGVAKSLVFAALPFFTIAVASNVGRRIAGGRGGIGADCFVAGASILPCALAMVVCGLFGFEHAQWMFALAVLAGCTSTLMMFSGYSRVVGISERASTLLVPITMLVCLWLANGLAESILSGSFGSHGPAFGNGGGFGQQGFGNPWGN